MGRETAAGVWEERRPQACGKRDGRRRVPVGRETAAGVWEERRLQACGKRDGRRRVGRETAAGVWEERVQGCGKRDGKERRRTWLQPEKLQPKQGNPVTQWHK